MGAAVGTTLALLFAPEGGKELRANIQSVAGQDQSITAHGRPRYLRLKSE
ncbi:hypothetical protein ACFLYD_05110 [Chloroflexota bacterium]